MENLERDWERFKKYKRKRLNFNWDYIKNYKVKKDQLYVYTIDLIGTKNKIVIENTEENRKILNDWQESQVRLFTKKEFKSEEKDWKFIAKILPLFGFSLLQGGCLFAFACSRFTLDVLNSVILFGSMSSFWVFIIIGSVVKAKDFKEARNTLKKRKYFVKHKKELNKGLEQSKELMNVLGEITTSIKMEVRTSDDEKKEALDIHMIDDLSYEQLVALRKKTKEEKSFRQDQQEKGYEKIKVGNKQ